MAYKKPENLEQGVKWLPSIQAMPVKLTLMSLWRARFLIKFLCVPFFLTELVASLLAGSQLSRWRASFLKELARPLFDKVPLRAVFLTELVASLLAGCHAKAGCQPAQWRASFLKELAASLLGGVPVF